MTGIGDTLEFSIANDLRGISSAAARIDAFCAGHDLPSGMSFDVTLAVDELVTNAIGYGFDDDGEHPIDIALCLDGDRLTVEIADDGKAFDPLQVPEPDLSAPAEERAKGGLGIYLVRKTMDAVAYRRENGRNVVTLTTHAARRPAE